MRMKEAKGANIRCISNDKQNVNNINKLFVCYNKNVPLLVINKRKKLHRPCVLSGTRGPSPCVCHCFSQDLLAITALLASTFFYMPSRSSCWHTIISRYMPIGVCAWPTATHTRLHSVRKGRTTCCSRGCHMCHRLCELCHLPIWLFSWHLAASPRTF